LTLTLAELITDFNNLVTLKLTELIKAYQQPCDPELIIDGNSRVTMIGIEIITACQQLFDPEINRVNNSL
jgi:hypothetical protein